MGRRRGPPPTSWHLPLLLECMAVGQTTAAGAGRSQQAAAPEHEDWIGLVKAASVLGRCCSLCVQSSTARLGVGVMGKHQNQAMCAAVWLPAVAVLASLIASMPGTPDVHSRADHQHCVQAGWQLTQAAVATPRQSGDDACVMDRQCHSRMAPGISSGASQAVPHHSHMPCRT